ncbi:MAG TPA: 2-isopropylmalate synthase [Candidatus Paceibacterota bacterium]|nr:hypothetical protein [Bacteriovoracaceae bacterium]HJN63037.1 2-isopropylmalate synthase [Candidatus Paceibacterota bacterium]
MKLQIFDTTLRDGEQSPGNTMNPQEKLEIALALENLGVNIIEAGFPNSSSEDFDGCKLIGERLQKSIICGLARCDKEDIKAVSDALKEAHNPAIYIFVSTSDLHIKEKLGLDRKSTIELIKESLTYVRKDFKKIYFGLEDSVRSDKDFLNEVIETVSGFEVDCIIFADTVGYSQPSEIDELIRHFIAKFPKENFGIHCHNDLGLATSNTLSAIKAGVNQIQVTINGIGERAGNTSLEEVVAGLVTRKDYYNDITTNIDTKMIQEVSHLVYKTIGREASFEKPIVGVNAFRHEAGIHIDGILKEPKTYELIDPELFGAKRKFVYGRHSGKKDKLK